VIFDFKGIVLKRLAVRFASVANDPDTLDRWQIALDNADSLDNTGGRFERDYVKHWYQRSFNDETMDLVAERQKLKQAMEMDETKKELDQKYP